MDTFWASEYLLLGSPLSTYHVDHSVVVWALQCSVILEFTSCSKHLYAVMNLGTAIGTEIESIYAVVVPFQPAT